MQSIFICEDNLNQLNNFQTIINNYVMMEDLEMELTLATDNPIDILESLKEKDISNGIYFLDIDLNHEMDGLQLAQAIREYDQLGSIVFITTHAEMAAVTFKYKVEALDFIVKSSVEQIQGQMIEILKLIRERQIQGNSRQKQFVFTSGSKTRTISIDKILFFESLPQAHKIAINTFDSQYQTYDSLSNIEKYDDSFVRCHKSFVINIDNVESIDTKNKLVKMMNGSTCLLANSRIKKIKQLLLEKQPKSD